MECFEQANKVYASNYFNTFQMTARKMKFPSKFERSSWNAKGKKNKQEKGVCSIEIQRKCMNSI